MAAESEFSEEEITSHGADSIQDLLTRLSPFIGDAGEAPVLLINGKPTGFDRSILSYPAEALDRLAVLKPEAAAQYGEPAGRRVVNLVLKKQFSMLDVDAGANMATAGGQYGLSMSARRTAISGDTRWNVGARLSADSAFPKASRRLPPRSGIFDSIGFISAPGGGEIDPALSVAAGQVVTAAAIPPGALTGSLSGPPGLNDFASTAGALHPVDPNRFETLQSSRRNASLAIGATRPIGDFFVSLSLNAGLNSSKGRRGLPMASVILPADHPWSSFTDDVLLTRPLAGVRALRIENSSTSLGASLTLSGSISSWQTNLALNYSRNWADNLLENGIDVARVQQLIDSADQAFNPYGRWDDSLLLATHSRTSGENLGIKFNVRKTIIDLPAGPLVWNFTANAGRNSTHSRQRDGLRALNAESRITRNQSNGQMTISVPISRRGGEGGGLPGDLTIDLSASAQTMTDSRPQKQFGGTINWSPWSILQLSGSFDRTEASPSFDQLDAPIITTVERVFDYVRQEVAEPLWITGGNRDLGRGVRQNLSLTAIVRPLGSEMLTLNLGYRQSVAKGGVAAFPELTPAIEEAFPERVTRDADNRLVAVDARAINIAHNSDANLSTSLALRLGPGGRRGRQTGRSGQESDPLQFSLSITHGWRLKSELLTRAGVPAIDLLRDSGQSRHSLSLQASVGKRGIGASLNSNWSGPSSLRGTGAADSFRFKPPLTLNLSAFAEPERLFSMPKGKGMLNGMKISVDVQNLFNGYRRVRLADGSVPAGYSRDEIDPLGRTVRVSLRKKF